ncbi:MAG: hypothetical protein H0W29_15720, partial [Gemmatimonadales bacterium]|nr:hypothetical protein [Gemmatimonadales bacterium]
MMTRMASLFSRTLPTVFALLMALAPAVAAQGTPVRHGGGEASLVVPDLSQVQFGSFDGR